MPMLYNVGISNRFPNITAHAGEIEASVEECRWDCNVNGQWCCLSPQRRQAGHGLEKNHGSYCQAGWDQVRLYHWRALQGGGQSSGFYLGTPDLLRRGNRGRNQISYTSPCNCRHSLCITELLQSLPGSTVPGLLPPPKCAFTRLPKFVYRI